MITEDYCSYEVAKLLKDKGFDGLCYCHEFTDYEGNFTTYHTEYPENWNQSEPCVSIPTLGMAMKWLREVHHIAINIGWGEIFEDQYQWWSKVLNMDNGDLYCEHYNASYEESVEDTLKYILENLI